MNDSEWRKDKWGNTCFGKMTDNRLKNTNGVVISPGFGVCIAHFNANGIETRTCLYCNEDEFEI
jgi:hypothetical protein